jgi:hypothetical protein
VGLYNFDIFIDETGLLLQFSTLIMATPSELQTLLRFLSKDAKLPLATAMSKVRELQKADLTRCVTSPFEIFMIYASKCSGQRFDFCRMFNLH